MSINEEARRIECGLIVTSTHSKALVLTREKSK